MKKKVFLVLIEIIIVVGIIGLTYEIESNRNLKTSNNSSGMFAIYLEKEKNTGNYEESNSSKWPQGDEYAINMKKTHCENGSVLRWNMETKKMKVITQGSDKCYVYFDLAEYGTEEHPYLIQTIEDLVRLSNDVNGGKTYVGKYFLLTNDLDFNDSFDYEDSESTSFGDINGVSGAEPLIKELTTGSGFMPIGKDDTNSFQGNFDGGNKRIDNLYIDNNKKIHIGLFGYGKNITLSNLTMSGKIINTFLDIDVGGFTGYVTGESNFINLTNYIDILYNGSGNISTSESLNNYGGIIGFSSDSDININYCRNYASIVGPRIVGGLVGDSIDSNLKIENSNNNGNITSPNTSGGILGHAGSSNVIINKSNNIGSIFSSGPYASGILGVEFSHRQNPHNIYILNSYNLGKVEASTSAQGFLLMQYGNIYIFNSFNYGKIISPNNSGKGLIYAFSDEKVRMNNIFNSSDEKYAIGVFRTIDDSIVENTYYLKSDDIIGSNANFGTSITKDVMQSQEFVDTLNQNVESINLGEIDESLKDYTLSKWKLGENGYPTLINE